ncbi:MAG: hypothetical protein ABIS21_07735, partial [Acidimicrobiales bacterium]
VTEEYRSVCVTLGRQVRVEMSDGTLTGTALDVSNEGHLLVSPTGGTGAVRVVVAGDVIHLRPDLSV